MSLFRRIADAFNSAKHPRGKPKNAGQFTKAGSGTMRAAAGGPSEVEIAKRRAKGMGLVTAKKDWGRRKVGVAAGFKAAAKRRENLAGQAQGLVPAAPAKGKKDGPSAEEIAKRQAAGMGGWTARQDWRRRKKAVAAGIKAAATKAANLKAKQQQGGGAPAAGAGGPKSEKLQAIETHLLTSPVDRERPMNGGVNNVQKLTFADGKNGVFKPRPTGREIRHGLCEPLDTEREVAAWELAKVVGLTDLATPCVKRHVKVTLKNRQSEVREGALMSFISGVDACDAQDKMYDGARDLARCAMFDYVIGNTDRHAGNWKIDVGKHVASQGKADQIGLIDHGLAFPGSTNHRNYRSAFVDEAKRRFRTKDWKGVNEKVDDLSSVAKPYLENHEKIMQTLKNSGLPPDVLASVEGRLVALRTVKDWSQLRWNRFPPMERWGGSWL